MSGKKKYSNEFKLKLVQEYLKGDKGGFRQIAKEYGVDDSVLKQVGSLVRG